MIHQLEDNGVNPCSRLLILVLVLRSAAPAPAADRGNDEPLADHGMMTDEMPGSEFQLDRRLVAAGQTVTFRLRGAMREDRFEIFPRYLERCDPERARKSPAPLQCLLSLRVNGAVTYRPWQEVQLGYSRLLLFTSLLW